MMITYPWTRARADIELDAKSPGRAGWCSWRSQADGHTQRATWIVVGIPTGNVAACEECHARIQEVYGP